jgi:hypothetical protein
MKEALRALFNEKLLQKTQQNERTVSKKVRTTRPMFTMPLAPPLSIIKVAQSCNNITLQRST